MKIPSIVSTNSIKLLSGLGNNEDSLTAMIIKDWIGDGATVYTYKKEGVHPRSDRRMAYDDPDPTFNGAADACV